jgi:hypothetical protein
MTLFKQMAVNYFVHQNFLLYRENIVPIKIQIHEPKNHQTDRLISEILTNYVIYLT